MIPSPRPAELFFLPCDPGQRLCTFHAPGGDSPPLAALVFVHACGEEMNKSRRMVALQARAMARNGCAVLTIDLLGCGDSSGDLQEATWPAWLADVAAACDWMTARLPETPLWLWGHRAGALLASLEANRRAQPPNLLLWQPLLSGRPQVQQLLRMKAAASLADGIPTSELLTRMKQALARGESVEIGGYAWPAALMHELESAVLAAPVAPCRVVWFEVSSRAEPGLTPASIQLLDTWRRSGVRVESHAIRGPAFWQTTEIELAPDLLDATVSAVLRDAGAAA